MPNLDPATRARLADALEGATPEEISAFARIALDRAMFYRSNEGQRIYLTLAALALAVSVACEHDAACDPAALADFIRKEGA